MAQKLTTALLNDECAILIQGTIVLILFLLALVGNGILILAYLRDHHMRTPTNMLVISHTSAEFSFAVNGILVYGSSLIRLKVLGGKLCILAGTINMFLFFVSILSLAAISVDRYFAVVKRSHHRFTKKTVSRVLIFIWSLAAFSAVPWELVVLQKSEKRFIAWVLGNCGKAGTLSEYKSNPFVLTYRIILWFVSFHVPCCMIFYFSVRILRSALRKRVRVHVLEFRAAADAYSNSAFTSIIIIAVYFLCLVPAMVFYIYIERDTNFYSLPLHSLAKIAMSFRSVCYPVIFISRNKKFSGYVRSFFAKKLKIFRFSHAEPCSGLSELGCRSLRCDANSQCNIAMLPLSKTVMFRAAPPKLAFTDLSKEQPTARTNPPP